MDTVNAVVAEHKPDANITKFMVAGGSKVDTQDLKSLQSK